MRRLLSICVTVVAVAVAGLTHAGQIWTDGDGDGLPDSGPFPTTASTNVTVGVWMDAQSFTFTNFLAFVENNTSCMTYVSASYVITGGSNFPVDDFSNPNAIGFGGLGYNRGGVAHIGNITYHIDAPTACCVTPIIDPANSYDTFSQLTNDASYMLFSTNPGTCYGTQEPAGACCFPDASCAVMLALQCQAAGGIGSGQLSMRATRSSSDHR